MAIDVNANVFVTLAQAKAWLKMASSVVLASPAPTTTGATVADGSVFKIGAQLTWIAADGTVKGRSVIQSNASNVLTWLPALSAPPAAGDFITEGSRDDQIILMLNGLVDSLERTTGRIFTPRQVTEVVTGRDTDGFTTDFAPIVTVDEVRVDGVVYTPGTQYQFDARRGFIRLARGYSFVGSNAIGNVSVTYTAGYVPIPGDAVSIIIQAMKIVYDGWATGGVSVNTLNIGGFGLSVVQDWPAPLRRIVQSFVDSRRMAMSKSI